MAVDDNETVLQTHAAAAVPVLTNDTDVDGGTTTIVFGQRSGHGTVVLTGGSVGAHTGLTYEPDGGYCNTQAGGSPDTFTYTINGGSSATVTMTVSCPPNEAPVLAAIESGSVGYSEQGTAVPVTSTPHGHRRR